MKSYSTLPSDGLVSVKLPRQRRVWLDTAVLEDGKVIAAFAKTSQADAYRSRMNQIQRDM